MSKARGLADLGNAYSDGALSNRNLIINGAMQVAQRGTSGGATAGYVYTVDRWLANGNITSWSQTGSQKDVLQFVTQAGTGIAQRVESKGSNLVSGNTYTLSFQVNPSVADVEIGITFRNGDSYLSNVVPVTDVSSQVTAGSYSKVTHTFTLGSSADIDTYVSHNMQVYVGSSVVNTINLKEVQLEVGDTATPFEHRSYGDELQRCKRYYRKMDIRIGCLPWAASNAQWDGESRAFDPEMRAAPAVTQLMTPTYSSSITTVPNQNLGTASSVNVNTGTTPDRVQIQNNATGGTIFAVRTYNAYDAEL